MTGSRSGDPIVIGVGNDFRRDDGAGPAVVAALREAGGVPGARLACCDGEPARLIDLWAGSRLAVLVDAAAPDPGHGLRPGDVLRWDGDRPDRDGRQVRAVSDGSAGSHSLGPGAALRLARVLDREPERLVVLAVVGADFGPGPGLSAPVAAAVDRVVDQVRAEIALTRADAGGSPSRRAVRPWS